MLHPKPRTWLFWALAILPLAGCTCGGKPAQLSFTVQPSNAVAGAGINPAVQVSVLDQEGKVLTSSDATITLALSGGAAGATATGTLSVKAISGVASFPGIKVEKAAQGYVLTASVDGVPALPSQPFDVIAANPAKILFGVQPTDGDAGGLLPPIEVWLTDAYDNLSGTGNSITIGIDTNPSGAVLSGNIYVSTVNGVARFTELSIDKQGDGYTLVASGGVPSSAFSQAFKVRPRVESLAFTTQPTDTGAGQTLAPAVQVTLYDGVGAVATFSNATVTLSLAGGSGTLGGTTSVAAVSGVATFGNLSITQLGSYTLQAGVSTLTAQSTAFNVTAGPPAALVFVNSPTVAYAGRALSPAVQLKLVDAFGNPSPSTAAVTMAIGTNPSGATLAGTLTRNASAGLVSFNDLSISAAGAGFTLRATSGSLPAANSTAFDVLPAPAAGLSYLDPAAGGKLRLVKNTTESTATTVVLDLVAAAPLSGYSVGFNLPLDATKVKANATLMSLPASPPLSPGSSPAAQAAALPTTGPLAGVLVTAVSQKAAGAGAVSSDTAIASGTVLYTVRLDAISTANPGLVFDGSSLGPAFRGLLRDRAGNDIAVSSDFRIGRLELF